MGYNPGVGKLLALVLVVALSAVAVAAYNAFVYELLQPVPRSWNHSVDELRLIELERERRNLVAQLGANQRVTSLAGAPQIGVPDENQKDLVEIPDNIKGNLEIKAVKWIDEVLQVALTHQPTPTPVATKDEKSTRRNGRKGVKDVVPAH